MKKLVAIVIALAALVLAALLALKGMDIMPAAQPQMEEGTIPLEQFLSYAKKDGDALVLPDLYILARQNAKQAKNSDELIGILHKRIRSGEYTVRRVSCSGARDEAAMAAYQDMIAELYDYAMEQITLPVVDSPFGSFGGES